MPRCVHGIPHRKLREGGRSREAIGAISSLKEGLKVPECLVRKNSVIQRIKETVRGKNSFFVRKESPLGMVALGEERT